MMLFWAQGYRATSVADLVKATGAKRSTLYRTHADKESLFLATLEAYASFRVGLLSPEARGVELARQWMESALMPFQDADFPLGCLLLATASEFPALTPAIQNAVRRHLDKVRDLFTMALKQHDPEADPSKPASVLMGANAALFLLARAGDNERHLRTILDEAISRAFK